MRKAPVLRQLYAPNPCKARTPEVKVDVKDLLAGLGMRNRHGRRSDRLAFAGLGRYDEKAPRERLVAGRVEKVPQARDRLGELRVLVLDQELGDLFAALAADVRKHREDLERETPLDVGEVHDRILEIVDDKDEEKPEAKR